MPWEKIGPTPAHSMAVYADRLAAMGPNRQFVYSYRPGTGWSTIGGAAKELIGNGDHLFALTPDGSQLWRYLGTGNSWEHIGGPGGQFVGIGETVYATTTDNGAVYCWERAPHAWKQVGGPAGKLVPGGDHLYALTPDGSQLWRYTGEGMAWEHIGGPGADFAGIGDTVYGLTPDKSAVYRWEREPHQWTKVGGPAAKLVAGGDVLGAISPSGDIWLFDDATGAWAKAGGPGNSFAKTSTHLYGLTPSCDAIWGLPLLDGESKALSDLLDVAYSPEEFGARITRGFLVREVGGPAIAQRRSRRAFQPLSTLKLLPYLHALIDVGQGTQLSSQVSWTEATMDDPATPWDERIDANCLQAGAPNTQGGSAPLIDALPTMMWESHNRTLDAVLERFGPDKITKRAQDDLGLLVTRMYFGCQSQAGSGRTWPWNRTTLHEVGRIFEGVDRLEFVGPAQRTSFFDLMINLDYAGASYSSPITGRTTGPLNNGFLRDLVKAECAALGKPQAIVESFLSGVVLRGKGGGGGPSSDEFGSSDFLHVTLPFKVNGAVQPRSFLVGWFVYGLRTPPGCPDPGPGAAGACADLWQKQRDALEAFRLRIHREPIRRALTTW